MTTPIASRPIHAADAALSAPIPPSRPSVAPGIGGASTTIASAQGQELAKPGYLMTFVGWVTGWISWAFQTVCCCFCRRDPVADAPPAEQTGLAVHEGPPAPPVSASTTVAESSPILPAHPMQAVFQRRYVELLLLNHFTQLAPDEQNLIYIAIGQAIYRRSNPTHWGRSYENIGRYAVERNPMLLEPYFRVAPASSA